MQFEQPASTPAFPGQQSGQQFQQTSETHQSGSTGSNFQGQGSSVFTSQQTGFTGGATVQNPVQMEQSSATGFQGQGHGYQQIQPAPTQSSQLNMNSPEGFQNQPAGFQQEYSVAGASAQSGQLDQPGSVSSGYASQSQGFSQQYSMDTPPAAQGELGSHTGGSFQTQGVSYPPQAHQQCGDSSSGHVQTKQQQVSQHDNAYPNSSAGSGKEQTSLSSAVYHNQNTDYQNQQTFHSEYAANSGTSNPLQAVVQASGFQQQYPSSVGSQPGIEERDFSQQQSMQDFTNQVTSFQQQQQQQQQPAQQQSPFQQGSQSAGNATTDQTYQASSTEGAPLHFSNDLAGYSRQTGQQQQQQGTTPVSAAVASPSGQPAGSVIHQQHAQYQNTTPSAVQADQGSAGTFQGQAAQYQKQQSFPSPTGSPGQPTQPVPSSPPSYPQPSQDYAPQHAYPSSGQVPAQGDQSGGVNFTGQVSGFTSGSVSGFQRKPSFQSPVQSPDQTHGETSVPSSPANNYQQQSPGFAAQPTYPAAGQSLGQGDQNTGSSFSTPTAGFSQSASTPGDQNVISNFQTNAVFSPKDAIQEDPNIAGGFQTQASQYARQSSAQSDVGTPSQTGGYQQTTFQPHTQATAHASVTPQPLQEGSGHTSMEAEAAEFLQKTLQSVNQQNQAVELEGGSASVQFQQISASQSATQRDHQPMETQQSPYLAGSGSGTAGFQNQSQAPVQKTMFHEPAAQVLSLIHI